MKMKINKLQTDERNIQDQTIHTSTGLVSPALSILRFVHICSKVSVVMSPLLRPYFGVESFSQANGEVGLSRCYQRRFEDFKTSL